MIEPFKFNGARHVTLEKPLPLGALTSRGALGAADARTVTRGDGGLAPTDVVAVTLT